VAIDNFKYQNLIIFYFSGTGNSEKTALWFGEVSEKENIETVIYRIEDLKGKQLPEIPKKTLIGICSATHGFNLPPLVLKFIRKLPIAKSNDMFIINTRAGIKLHKAFLPGLSGMAQIVNALWLRLKGYKIVGMQPMDMPSNWILVHPGLRNKVVKSIHARCEKKTKSFAAKILSGKKKYKALLSLPLDIAVIPIAILYYFVGRFFLAKTLIASFDCTKCGKCVKKCPVEAIKLVDSRPFWTYKCESCMRCVNICPERAIETTHLFAASMIIANSLLFAPFVIFMLDYFNVLQIVKLSVFTENVWEIISAYLFLIILFLNYRILHFLLRFRFVNMLFTYSSFSRFRFWRRYHANKGRRSKL